MFHVFKGHRSSNRAIVALKRFGMQTAGCRMTSNFWLATPLQRIIDASTRLDWTGSTSSHPTSPHPNSPHRTTEETPHRECASAFAELESHGSPYPPSHPPLEAEIWSTEAGGCKDNRIKCNLGRTKFRKRVVTHHGRTKLPRW